ncbi:DUF2490 domain-containing protein [Galbibacter orientalis]|uniref:DUF2490 domain-containing protein n=1 Tax=Galbibacter orientalis TaxID=453852 RepID=UPI001FDF6D31|nr:DUF2490 domain-containing protein [Galbibacter orientalis]
MGKVNTASWFATGIKQSLNKKETITSATYFGSGRISNPDNYNFFNKQSIYVLNEEISHRFKKNWKYALAISYRWQNKFKTTHPYELDTPKARQELRLYGRFYYLNSYKILDYSFSYRPEIRFFYNPDFKSATKNTQFRSRIRAKGSFNLNALKTRRIIISSEFLFSTTKTINWSKFEYQESRFCLYYSLIFPSEKIRLNFGYMNQLVGKKTITDAHYLAFDIILKNPF